MRIKTRASSAVNLSSESIPEELRCILKISESIHESVLHWFIVPALLAFVILMLHGQRSTYGNNASADRVPACVLFLILLSSYLLFLRSFLSNKRSKPTKKSKTFHWTLFEYLHYTNKNATKSADGATSFRFNVWISALYLFFTSCA